MGILANESVEEVEMSMLAAGFAAWMRKWDVDSKDKSTPIYDGKRPRRSLPHEEA